MGRPKKKRQKIGEDDPQGPTSSGNEETLWEAKDLLKATRKSKEEEITAVILERGGKFAARRETAFVADYSLCDPINILQSDPSYTKLCQRFVTERKEQTEKRRANVLDLFCGIGTGLVALKRLGIDINQYHFVDNDKAARHVLKQNHCCNHSTSAPVDLIQYIEHGDFQTIEKSLDSILKDNPIDIIIGGPPCQDFTRVNTNCRSVNGQRGNLLVKTMLLIRAIEKHPNQEGRPVFVMIENLVLEFNDLKATETAFRCSPVELDAQYFSPCCRNRHYWVNFPLGRYDFRGTNSKARPCLEDQWMMLGDAENDNEGITDGSDGHSKANTFMASKIRLDDHPRMSKVRKAGKRYFRGTYSAREREWMMGYPTGYVVNHTAEQSAKHLIGNAYSVPVVSFLLKPLKQVFKRRAYFGYNLHRANGIDVHRVYPFKWQDNGV